MSASATPGTGRRVAGYIFGGLGLVLAFVSALWWYGESVWGRYRSLTPAQAFSDGDFGLAIAPLKYILVAQSLSETALGKNWPQRFGFLSRSKAATGLCAKDAPGNLPFGFSVSNRLQGNATPVPVKFVGLTCATCHSAAIGKAGIIVGAGSQTADVIGFTDAFSNAVLDPSLSATKILKKYQEQCPGDEGFVSRLVDGFFIDQWLSGLRAQFRANATMYDMPYHGNEIGDPANIPTGPSRTRPFRSVVRNTLDFPGQGNVAYSKVPLAAMQSLKKWSQFDGSIGDPVVRSLIAVFTSGATIPALNEKQISDNVKAAADYTLRLDVLGEDGRPKTLADAFPDRPKPSADTLARGQALYTQYCDSCHGHPDAKGWQPPIGGRPFDQGKPQITPVDKIGTDAGRLHFRYNDMLPTALGTTFPEPTVDPIKEHDPPQTVGEQTAQIKAMADAAAKDGDLATADWWQQAGKKLDDAAREFPAGHRRAFPASELAKRDGYENSPIPYAWLRAPYLHNGSVPTLSELIGLDPRPTFFCRGNAGYDPETLGVIAPAPVPAGANGKCLAQAPFLFDTTKPGNSNAGHSFPPSEDKVSADDLKALLAYLGTL